MDTKTIESTAMHDAELFSLEHTSDLIKFTFVNVLPSVDNEDYYTAVVNLKGVRSIVRNDVPVHTVTLEGEGSSVLDFERNGNTAKLVLDWCYYSQKRSEFAVYEFAFEEFEISCELQDNFID